MRKRVIIASLALGLLLPLSACGTSESVDNPSQRSSRSEPKATPALTPDAAGEEASPAAEPKKPSGLTVETSEDVASLFAGPTHGKSILEAFVKKHQGQTIELDGYISFLIDSEKAVYSTAFVKLGDAQQPSPTGPMFEFTPVLLPPTSPLQQHDLSEGQNVHIKGTIGTTYAFEESPTYHPETEDRIVLVLDSVEQR